MVVDGECEEDIAEAENGTSEVDDDGDRGRDRDTGH